MNRIIKLKESLRKKRITAFLILNLRNIYYFTGFTGSNGYLLISNKGDFFFTDFRYKEQSERQISSDLEIIICRGDCIKNISEFLKKKGIKKLSIEDSITYRTYNRLSKTFSLNPQKDIVEQVRILKDDTELIHIKQAVKRAETAFNEIKGWIKEGAAEKSIAKRLDDAIRNTGAKSPAFDTIVASGNNSALPHAVPSQKKIQSGDLVVIDWGAESNGYFSDMTRTLLINGSNLEKKIEIYNIVLSANISAISSIALDYPIKSIDKTARDIIINAGFGEYFGHSTGHGVGLDIHEQPTVSQNSKRVKVMTGMVFTIEPGIYLPSIGGVRIEDMVSVSMESIETLTALNKGLEIIY
ncbi:MAG: aminopeptidase P family protein [Nitrospirae bacterium]|nr:aminopeptidase P family protein [Nitrospirota bacterium]